MAFKVNNLKLMLAYFRIILYLETVENKELC